MKGFILYVGWGFIVGLISLILERFNPTLYENKVTIEFSIIDMLLVTLGIILINNLIL